MTQGALWPDRDRTRGRGAVDHLERYYTPPELAEFVLDLLPWDEIRSVLEPHAGGGSFLRLLQRRAGVVWFAYDADPSSWACVEDFARCCDFLTVQHCDVDRVVGNPPFSNAEQHAEHALELAPEVAFLMPLDRLESAGRLDFWRRCPPRKVWILSERVWAGSRAIAWFWWCRGWTGATELEVVSWKGRNNG